MNKKMLVILTVFSFLNVINIFASAAREESGLLAPSELKRERSFTEGDLVLPSVVDSGRLCSVHGSDRDGAPRSALRSVKKTAGFDKFIMVHEGLLKIINSKCINRQLESSGHRIILPKGVSLLDFQKLIDFVRSVSHRHLAVVGDTQGLKKTAEALGSTFVEQVFSRRYSFSDDVLAGELTKKKHKKRRRGGKICTLWRNNLRN